MIYLSSNRDPPAIFGMLFFLLPDPPNPRIIRSVRGYNCDPRITNGYTVIMLLQVLFTELQNYDLTFFTALEQHECSWIVQYKMIDV